MFELIQLSSGDKRNDLILILQPIVVHQRIFLRGLQFFKHFYMKMVTFVILKLNYF